MVIGGGFGGATAAKYIKRFDPEISVTLVEPATRFVTCPFSNTVIGGLNSIGHITHGFEALKALGVQVVHDSATLIGVVLGAVVHRTNFCAIGAVSDVVIFGNWNRLRAWVLAMAVAMVGTQLMVQAELIDLGGAIYLGSRLTWAGAILGGLVFGIGMVLAGGCGNRNLVRLGAGDLRSLVVIMVMGLTPG